ncbi:fatty acid desaturase [Hoeflea sp. TYP-13]|uniref:fatty acid desaturase n=1 Tax=Hoeflea sp. TYP-13 TaxID=3230023 RepID=UPI0034C5CE68
MILKDKTEWRTVTLIATCYIGWLALLLGLSQVSPVAAAILIIPFITLHSSLQHECLHGHPFRIPWLNDAVVLPPIGLFIPYFRFKAVHLEHHLNARICDPYDDPESWYLAQDFWQRLPRWLKLVFEVNNTLAGRLILGPVIGLIRLVISDCRDIAGGDRAVLWAWVLHLALLAPILAIVVQWSALPVWVYVLCSYAGMSLLMVRTYLEHQAEESLRGRSVIIEDSGPFSLLFLNNNLHAVHHAYPAVAWHQLPSLYRRNRQRFLDMNKGYFFNSYAEIFRRFAFRRKEQVVHPFMDGGRS